MWRVLRPDSYRVWKDTETLKRLPRYRGIIDGERWAKYLLATDIDCDIKLDASLEDLWEIHSELSVELIDYIMKVD